MSNEIMLKDENTQIEKLKAELYQLQEKAIDIFKKGMDIGDKIDPETSRAWQIRMKAADRIIVTSIKLLSMGRIIRLIKDINDNGGKPLTFKDGMIQRTIDKMEEEKKKMEKVIDASI